MKKENSFIEESLEKFTYRFPKEDHLFVVTDKIGDTQPEKYDDFYNEIKKDNVNDFYIVIKYESIGIKSLM